MGLPKKASQARGIAISVDRAAAALQAPQVVLMKPRQPLAARASLVGFMRTQAVQAGLGAQPGQVRSHRIQKLNGGLDAMRLCAHYGAAKWLCGLDDPSPRRRGTWWNVCKVMIGRHSREGTCAGALRARNHCSTAPSDA